MDDTTEKMVPGFRDRSAKNTHTSTTVPVKCCPKVEDQFPRPRMHIKADSAWVKPKEDPPALVGSRLIRRLADTLRQSTPRDRTEDTCLNFCDSDNLAKNNEKTIEKRMNIAQKPTFVSYILHFFACLLNRPSEYQVAFIGISLYRLRRS